MSVGLRDQRVTIYSYADTGVDGMPGSAYTRVPSSAPDGAWWARVEPVSARESQIAANTDHQVDVVIAFADEVTGLTTDGVLKHEDTIYKVSGIRPARVTRETIVHATYASQEVYDQVTE